MRRQKVRQARVNMEDLENAFYASKFVISDPDKKYLFLKTILPKSPDATYLGDGQYSIIKESSLETIIKSFFKSYSLMANTDFHRILIQQIGLLSCNNKSNNYMCAVKGENAIVMNIREQEGNYHSEMVLNIQDQKIPKRNTLSFGVILPTQLGNFSLSGGENHPKTRRLAAKSFFIMMYFTPNGKQMYDLADKALAATPINPDSLSTETKEKVFEGLSKLEKYLAEEKEEEESTAAFGSALVDDVEPTTIIKDE